MRDVSYPSKIKKYEHALFFKKRYKLENDITDKTAFLYKNNVFYT